MIIVYTCGGHDDRLFYIPACCFEGPEHAMRAGVAQGVPGNMGCAILRENCPPGKKPAATKPRGEKARGEPIETLWARSTISSRLAPARRPPTEGNPQLRRRPDGPSGACDGSPL